MVNLVSFRLLCVVATALFVVFVDVTYGQGGSVYTLTQAQINEILNNHNQIRSSSNVTSSGSRPLPSPSPDMPLLTWDSGLASVWGPSYASRCTFAHTNSTYRQIAAGKSNSVGENLSCRSGSPDLTALISGWYGEEAYYGFQRVGDTIPSGQTVGHYTQVIWAGSTAVGCSLIDCTGYSSCTYFLACDYYPAGNYYGQVPYTCAQDIATCSGLGVSCGTNYADYCNNGATKVCQCDTGAASSTPSPSSSPAPITRTPTVTPTASSTSAPSQSLPPSSSNTASATSPPSASRTSSSTNTATATSTASVTPVPSSSETPSPTGSISITSSSSVTPSPSVSIGLSPSQTSAPSSTSSVTPSISSTSQPSVSTAASSSSSPTSPASLSMSSSASVSGAPSTAASSSNTPTSAPSTTPSSSPSASCVPLTCQALGAQCGNPSDGCGGTLSCSSCSANQVCSQGTCISNPSTCTPSCTSVSQVCDTTSLSCVCAPGYVLGLNGGCGTPQVSSNSFPLTPYVNSTPNYWVVPTETQSTDVPEIDMLDSSGVRHTLLWDNTDKYGSLSNTTISIEVDSEYATGSTLVFGIGYRLGQASSGVGVNDSIETRISVGLTSNFAIVGGLNAYKYGNVYNIATVNGGTGVVWNPTGFNKVTTIVATVGSNITITILINSVNIFGQNNAGSYILSSSYYPMLGKVYFSSSGVVRFRNAALSTLTTIHVVLRNCMTTQDWNNFVLSVLGVSPGTIDQTSSNPACSNSAGKKRQAAGALTAFTFTIPDGLAGQSSSALATQFLAEARLADGLYARMGIDIASVNQIDTVPSSEAPANTVPVTIDATPADGGGAVAGAGGGDGLSTGAIVGIVVGGGIGLLLIGGLVIAAIVGAIVAIVLLRRRQTLVRDIEMESTSISDDVPPRKRKGVDVFDPQDRTRSIGGRVPTIYKPAL